jgi:mannose/fructose/N-acetylgalactosamine-specific phosphotransferase system component IIC
MGTFRLLGVFAFVHATVILTISFFVIFALRKVETKNLKMFGRVIVGLLWLGAILVFSVGIYITYKGKCKMRPMMQQMMQPHMQHHMMKDKMPPQ